MNRLCFKISYQNFHDLNDNVWTVDPKLLIELLQQTLNYTVHDIKKLVLITVAVNRYVSILLDYLSLRLFVCIQCTKQLSNLK